MVLDGVKIFGSFWVTFDPKTKKSGLLGSQNGVTRNVDFTPVINILTLKPNNIYKNILFIYIPYKAYKFVKKKRYIEKVGFLGSLGHFWKTQTIIACGIVEKSGKEVV